MASPLSLGGGGGRWRLLQCMILVVYRTAVRRVTKCNLEIMTLLCWKRFQRAQGSTPAAATSQLPRVLFGSVAPPALLKLCNKPPDLLAVFWREFLCCGPTKNLSLPELLPFGRLSDQVHAKDAPGPDGRHRHHQRWQLHPARGEGEGVT